MMERKLSAVMLAWLVMAGCSGGSQDTDPAPGGGGGGGPSGGSDTQVPTAQIVFPPTASATEASRITVRGTASDDGSVSAVRVNGMLASTSDAFMTWTASVPLLPGQNTLTVEVVDGAENRNAVAAQVIVKRSAMLKTPRILALDGEHDRAIVYDVQTASLSSVDTASGMRTQFSPAPSRGDASSISFGSVGGIAIDSVNRRALVVDAQLPGIVAVSLDTGVRTLFSGASVPDSVNQFVLPLDIALDAAHDRVLVVDDGLDAVIAVSLTNGSRTILSGTNIPNATNAFSSVSSLAVDPVGNRALVVDNTRRAVLAVSLSSGARSVLSDSTTPNAAGMFSGSLLSIAVDPAHNRAVVADELGLVGVSLVNGARTLLADTAFFADDIALDASGNRVLVTSDFVPNQRAIFSVDLATGVETLLEDPILETDTPLLVPSDVAIDAASQRLLVLSAQLNQVIAIDLGQGRERAVLAQLPFPTDSSFILPSAIVLDPVNQRALVTDLFQQAVTAVDLATGATNVLLDDVIGSPNTFFGAAIDSANRRLFFTSLVLGSVSSADLSNPLAIAPTVLASGPPLNLPRRLAFDSAADRVLVTDGSDLLAIAANGGTPVVLGRAPEGKSLYLSGIAVDAARNQALIVDASGFLFAANLVDGSFSVLAEDGGPNALTYPEGIVLDTANDRIFIADPIGVVIAIDRRTGERVFF